MREPAVRKFPAIFSLPFLFFLFLLSAVLSFVLLRESLHGLFTPGFFQTPASFVLLFAVPFGLIVLAGMMLYLLISETMKTGPLHPAALRIFRTACLLAALFSAVVCIFSNAFIRNLFAVYHDGNIRDSVHASFETAETYTGTREKQAETVADKFLTGLNTGNLLRIPRPWIPDIREYDPYALAVQVYEVSGGEFIPVKEEGDSSVFAAPGKIARQENGIFHEHDGTQDLLRLRKTLRYAGKTYVALYTTAFPEVVVQTAQKAEQAVRSLSVLEQSMPLFPVFGFWLFFSFLLPPLLMLLPAVFVLCVRFSDPLAALENTCAALARGDTERCLISHPQDGLQAAAALVNARSEQIRRKKRSPVQEAESCGTVQAPPEQITAAAEQPAAGGQTGTDGQPDAAAEKTPADSGEAPDA